MNKLFIHIYQKYADISVLDVENSLDISLHIIKNNSIILLKTSLHDEI